MREMKIYSTHRKKLNNDPLAAFENSNVIQRQISYPAENFNLGLSCMETLLVIKFSVAPLIFGCRFKVSCQKSPRWIYKWGQWFSKSV